LLPLYVIISRVTASTEWLRGAQQTQWHSWHPRLIRELGEQFPDRRQTPGIETPIFLQQCQCANVATAARLEDERAANAMPHAFFTTQGGTKVFEHSDTRASAPAAVPLAAAVPQVAVMAPAPSSGDPTMEAAAVVGEPPQAVTALTAVDQQYPGFGAYAPMIPPAPQYLVPMGYQFLPDYGYPSYGGLTYPTVSVPGAMVPPVTHGVISFPPQPQPAAALMGPQQLSPMSAVAAPVSVPYGPPPQQAIVGPSLPSTAAQAPQVPISTQVVDAGGHHSVQISVSAVPEAQGVPQQQPYVQSQAVPEAQAPAQHVSIPYSQPSAPASEAPAQPAPPPAAPATTGPATENNAGVDETTKQAPSSARETQNHHRDPPPAVPMKNAPAPAAAGEDTSIPAEPEPPPPEAGPPSDTTLLNAEKYGRFARPTEPVSREGRTTTQQQFDAPLPDTESFMRRMLYSMAPRSFFDSPDENRPSRVEVETTRITHKHFAPEDGLQQLAYGPPQRGEVRRGEERASEYDDPSVHRSHSRVIDSRGAPLEREPMPIRFGQQPIYIKVGDRK